MQFLIMTYENPEDFSRREGDAEAYFAEWMAYVDAIHQSGVVVASAGLQPPETATSVTTRGGERTVQDGPFADSKEQLGGFFLIEVPDLDAALEWGRKAARATTLPIEVRPFHWA